ncbi:HNMT methyltransferase, partial [Polyodon spathula]|nr:histamine N-methyltransferase [Polyodon spathula]XP_041120741.1 histamine N-methyltransferase [Polyodon spathula]MBN3279119.1 HNMT methyltransferase [Polyodon spathula]
MASSMKSLLSNESRYLKSFNVFLDRSTEHKCMQVFIDEILPGQLASIGDGKSSFNVLGVGSGAGAIDLQILSKLQSKHPGASVNNEIVEPSSEQIHNYKVLVAKTPNLENVSFNWNKMTSSEYENHVKEKKEKKTFDFIHMIQMLYYVSDPAATIKFIHSLLGPKGKLLIILVSGNSGWFHLWKTYRHRLCFNECSLYITTHEIKEYLDSIGLKYQHYELPSYLDITECFIEGDEKGELLVDFLTETCEFSKTAPSDLKAEIMSFLRQPEYITEKDGKIIFNNTLGAIVVEP